MSISNINDLLDSSIDDLADLPEFQLLNSGVHRVTVNFSKKEINGNPYVVMGMKLVETLELANPGDDTVQEPGLECDSLFNLNNEFGQGNLKKVVTPLAKHFGVGKISDALEAAQGCEVVVVISTKPDKKDPTVKRMNVTRLVVE